MCFCHQAV